MTESESKIRGLEERIKQIEERPWVNPLTGDLYIHPKDLSPPPEPIHKPILQVKVGGYYRTKGGNKAFIFSTYDGLCGMYAGVVWDKDATSTELYLIDGVARFRARFGHGFDLDLSTYQDRPFKA